MSIHHCGSHLILSVWFTTTYSTTTTTPTLFLRVNHRYFNWSYTFIQPKLPLLALSEIILLRSAVNNYFVCCYLAVNSYYMLCNILYDCFCDLFFCGLLWLFILCKRKFRSFIIFEPVELSECHRHSKNTFDLIRSGSINRSFVNIWPRKIY